MSPITIPAGSVHLEMFMAKSQWLRDKWQEQTWMFYRFLLIFCLFFFFLFHFFLQHLPYSLFLFFSLTMHNPIFSKNAIDVCIIKLMLTALIWVHRERKKERNERKKDRRRDERKCSEGMNALPCSLTV